MPKVRMITCARGGVLNADPGDVVEVSESLADDLVAGHAAVRLEEVVETAEAAPAEETAAKRRAPRKRVKKEG